MTAVAPPRAPEAGARDTVAMPGWLRDLGLGLRLAVGGGRTSLIRIVLGTIGTGLAVAVLLLAASATTVLAHRDARVAANSTVVNTIPGVTPLLMSSSEDIFQGQSIDGAYLRSGGPTSPVPPGLAKVPAPGEMVVSPALDQLLKAPGSALLRARYSERITGTIGSAGLEDPNQLSYYAGAGDLGTTGWNAATPVYAFGLALHSHNTDPQFVLLIALAAVALLVPILLFVAVTSRIAGAQRDRRLAALRLVGAGSRQVRRIASAEALVPSAFGLVLGTGLFLVLRQLASGVELFGWSVFTADLVPPWPLALIVVVVVPVLAVTTALFAMRRTVIEPLGVLRLGKPVRRRMIWRFAVGAVGVGLLLITDRSGQGISVITLTAGIALVLLAIPMVLPWVLERVVGLFRGGAPSWQLAVRRLQLDSGTPARVVGGIAVVLAAAVAVQTLLFGAFERYELQQDQTSASSGLVTVVSDTPSATGVERAIRSTSAARVAGTATQVTGLMGDELVSITVADCNTLVQLLKLDHCADGQAFRLTSPGGTVDPGTQPGARLGLTDEYTSVEHPKPVSYWTVPASLQTTSLRVPDNYSSLYDLVVTPSALQGVRMPSTESKTFAWINPDQPNGLDLVRNAVAPFTWHVNVEAYSDVAVSSDQSTFSTIQSALFLGAVFTLSMAGVSMLVLALEQVRERRRPLAALAASGVPRAVLARSLLWQTAVPVVVGVIVAVGAGIGLGALMLRLTNARMTVDWATVGLFAGATIVLVLLVTALTLPSLRSATRLNALRTE